jgi:RecA/RadA recombinase
MKVNNMEPSARTKDIRKSIQAKRRDKPKKLVPSGLVPLDIAGSDSLQGAFRLGSIINIVGDSHTGKSMLILNMLATLANDPNFDDHTLIYDDAEHADDFDKEYLFGSTAAKRIVSPKQIDGVPVCSETMQDFIANVEAAFKKGKFIYVLDSLDSINTKEEQQRYKDFTNEVEKGKDSDKLSSSYKTEKAKYMSELLRQFRAKIRKTDSLLVFVSQTREKIDAIGFGDKKTRAGGKALEFYCHFIAWLAHKRQIKNLKYKKVIGNEMTIKITKNKFTGKKREVDALIYYDLGVDNVGAMVDFLVNEEAWKKSKTINAVDLEVNLTRSKLIQHIEDNNLESKLAEVCLSHWMKIENELKLSDRKRRFA